MKKNERQTLEAQGWTFRPGPVTPDELEHGYARVPSGAMVPPRSEKARLAAPLCIMGALALGAIAASKMFSPQHTVADRLHGIVGNEEDARPYKYNSVGNKMARAGLLGGFAQIHQMFNLDQK